MQQHPPAPGSTAAIRWGPFALRIPFLHLGVCWPELLQGIFVAGATGMALIPILNGYFGLTFEEAVAFVFITSLLICSAPILFGEPYAPGWITPALPLVLLVLVGPDAGELAPDQRFQFMTALSLNFALLLLILGLTGMGHRLILWLPRALKGGIIMGAAIAALKRVFIDDADRFLLSQPISTTAALVLCLILTFSVPLQKLKQKHLWLRWLTGLGLLPGFLIAALIGPIVGEVTYDVKGGFLIPPFGDLFAKASPFQIGWPSAETFLATMPLALMAYVILFGDLITGTEILKQAQPDRPDEKIEVNFSRSHLSIAIRNALMALTVPFFPTQGALWTGVQVVIVQRWREGRRAMASLYSGIASYYVFGIPVLYLILPLLTVLKPLMGVALSLTLVLTGFACAYVAMEIPRSPIERGVVILMAVALVAFPNPWIGMAIGIAATLALVGPETNGSSPAE